VTLIGAVVNNGVTVWIIFCLDILMLINFILIKGMYRRFNHLRSYNPHLTTMIGIGGWNEGSDKYSAMASSAASRKIFVDSVVKFLQKYDFDGLDLDWFANIYSLYLKLRVY
jgi:GH18 family chitinase